MRIRLLPAALVTAVLVVNAGCAGTEEGSSAGRDEVAVLDGDPLAAPDPAPEPTGGTTAVGPAGGTVDAGDVELIIPSGAVPEGATFTVPEVAPIPAQPGEVFGQPVGLEHDVPLARPVTVRWNLPDLTDVQRASIVLATWDPAAAVWVARPDVAFTVDNDLLTAELTEFSFWDWIANGGQQIGEVVGARKPAPTCNGQRLHSWVRGVVDPDQDTSAAAIRVCFEPDRNDIVTVRVVNNRPFAQRLTMTDGDQEWAWAWPGPEAYDLASSVHGAARTVFDSPTTFLLPPLSETAVGIGRPTEPGQVNIAAQARVDGVTVLVDVLTFGLEQVDVGGFENPLTNALAQAVLKCGGMKLLGRPDLRKGEELVRFVLGSLRDCAEEVQRADSEFGRMFRDLSNAALDRLGKGDAYRAKAQRLSTQAAKGFRALTFGKVAFYVADELQNALVGPLTVSIRGDGRPQELGAWSPSCTDLKIDSNRMYRNLALRDEFSNKSRELWQFSQWASSAAQAVIPLSRCSGDYRSRLADFLPGDWADPRAAEVVAEKVRALGGSSADPDRVRFDGIADLSLSLTADELLALGFVDQGNLYEGPGASCVRYARPQGGLGASVEFSSGRVLAIVNAGGNDRLRTEVGGIGIGSQLWEIREAFAASQYRIEERFQSDFGQGSNGVIIHGPGGDIGLALEDAPVGAYVEETVAVNWVAGVGLPGNAPTASETGC